MDTTGAHWFAIWTRSRHEQVVREQLERKHIDAIVVNDISRADIGFDVDQNEVTIVAPGVERRVPLASKAEIAAAVLDIPADSLAPVTGLVLC